MGYLNQTEKKNKNRVDQNTCQWSRNVNPIMLTEEGQSCSESANPKYTHECSPIEEASSPTTLLRRRGFGWHKIEENSACGESENWENDIDGKEGVHGWFGFGLVVWAMFVWGVGYQKEGYVGSFDILIQSGKVLGTLTLPSETDLLNYGS